MFIGDGEGVGDLARRIAEGVGVLQRLGQGLGVVLTVQEGRHFSEQDQLPVGELVARDLHAADAFGLRAALLLAGVQQHGLRLGGVGDEKGGGQCYKHR